MNKLHLLLLEEDSERASKLKTIFEESSIGYSVFHVQEHGAFAHAMDHINHDVVLSGNFSEVEGVSGVIKTINAKGRNIPYIVITNPINEEYAISLMKAGAFNYVLKERLEKLPDAIMSAIEKYRLSEKRERFLNDILPREALMREAERLAQFGSWKHDLVSGNVWWSDEQYRILGYEPGEVMPSWDHFLVKVHADDVEFVNSAMDDALKYSERKKYAFRVVDGPNSLRYIHSEVFVTRNDDMRAIQMSGFFRDMTSLVQSEIRSLENEKKYYNLFENNPCALVVIDIATTRILSVNRAAILQYGYDMDDFLSKELYEFLPQDEHIRYNESKDEFISGADYKGNWRVLKKDGSVSWAEITSTDILFEGKQCRLVLANDITDKLESINQLKESEERLINSQRIAQVGSWEVNLRDNNSVKWSDETYRIFGLEPNAVAITQELFFSIVHPEDHAIFEKAVMEAVNNGGVYSAEFRIVLQDGTERLVSELGEMIFDEQTGGAIKVTGTAQDITERRNARMLLQKSEANLRSIFENTDTAYVLLDMELRILSFNRPAYRFSEEHLTKTLEEGAYAVNYFSDLTQAVVKKSLRDALNGANLSYEVSYPDDLGVDKWYYAHFHPVWSDDRSMLGVIMSLRDITERKTSELQEKKMTSELVQRNKDLEQFAYIISHNLRAPVANILGITDALKDGDLDDADQVIFMNGLHDSARKLDDVITDLNRILQLKNGLSENKEKVLFSTLVRDIKYSIGNTSENEMFQLQADFSEVDEMITLKSYLHSIFYNLISNSIKYKKIDLIPVISITSKKNANGIELIFRDNGLGIDMEKNGGMLFGLYKRFNHNAAEGKGIGLFMVKTQVETLGGKISVSSNVGEGAEFKIEFTA